MPWSGAVTSNYQILLLLAELAYSCQCSWGYFAQDFSIQMVASFLCFLVYFGGQVFSSVIAS